MKRFIVQHYRVKKTPLFIQFMNEKQQFLNENLSGKGGKERKDGKKEKKKKEN